MKKDKKSSGRGFSNRGKVKDKVSSKEKKGFGLGFGTFKLPQGCEIEEFKVKGEKGKKKVKVTFDFASYQVTSKRHKEVKEGEFWYSTGYMRHAKIGAEEKNYVCLKTVGKKCPICDYRAQLIKQNGNQDEIDDLKAKERELFLPVVDGKVMLFDYSPYLFGQELDNAITEADEDGIRLMY